MKERPTSVTVFAVINLVLSGIGVLGLAWTLVIRVGLYVPPGAEDSPAYKLMQDNAGYRLMTDLLTGVGVVVTILIISASIGMFMLKPWSRLVTIGWGSTTS